MISMLFLYLSLLLPAVVNAANINTPQTGQTIINIAKDDGDLRAGTVWPTPRFSDNKNGTITDTLNGLVWSCDANLIVKRNPELTTTNGTVSWQSALDYVAKLKSENYLGHNDWRLPNLNELASVLNQGEPAVTTWLGRHGIVNAVPSRYWTATSVAFNPAQVWTINLDTGSIAPNAKSSVANVWGVRGGDTITADMSALPKTGQSACYDTAGEEILCTGTGQDGELRRGIEWPTPRFSENSNETVTDNLTGLIWVKYANLIAIRDPSFGSSSDGRVMWPNAIDYVNRLNNEAYLGYSDWRLPNRNELVSLINYAESNPTVWLNSQGFSNAQQHYWSSSTLANTTSNAWNASIAGDVSERNKYDSNNESFVWPVRGNSDSVQASVKSVTLQNKLVSAAPQTVVAAAAATLSVSTSILSAGTVGTAYSQTLAATGGTTPYTWAKTTGSLPAGLTLSTAGVISGTPTTGGTSTFTVQVKDKSAITATKSLTIGINGAPLSITSASLGDGYLATAYSQTLTATGGATPYSWTITTGTLPVGLSLAASTGIISGTPTAAGTSSITVQVKDANTTTTTKSLTITVYTLPAITTTSLPTGTIGTAYNQTLTVTGGKSSYIWSISSGTLPAGLTLTAATGIISGTLTASGTSSVTFKVADANAKSATQIIPITINAAPLSIANASLIDGYLIPFLIQAWYKRFILYVGVRHGADTWWSPVT
jgi:hypothetical protein